MSQAATRAAATIRVFLLEDFDAVRRGVLELLDEEPDIAVVGEAATVAEALRLAPLLRPHVAVLDVRLPDGDGVAVCRNLSSRVPELRCVLLTSLAEDDALLAAVLAGAAGYRLKQIRGTDLPDAVRTAATGRSLLDPESRARALDRIRALTEPAGTPAVLSGQQRAALDLIVAGRTDREIAERMGLTEEAVRGVVDQVLADLGVQRFTARTSVPPAHRT
jgi:two-component system, NarL family, response regulator DevR